MPNKTLLALAILMAAHPALAARRPLPEPATVETRTLGLLDAATPAAQAPARVAAPVTPPAPPAAQAAIETTVITSAPAVAAPVASPAATPAVVIPTSLPAVTPAPGPGHDGIWRKIMLGTWQALENPESTVIDGEATFTPDGKATGYTTATYLYADGKTSDVKVAIDFRWKIVDGVIILDQFESDPPGFIKKTQVRRFEIRSMNDTGAVFKDLDDGQNVYRRRKPN